MTKPSQVNFDNRTKDPVTIKPAYKSKWHPFTLMPFETKSVRDWNTVSDITFKVYARPRGGGNDSLIGEFKAHNDWIAADPEFSFRGSKLAFGYYGDKEYKGVNYATYYTYPFASSSEPGIISKIDEDKFDILLSQRPNPDELYYFGYTEEQWGAFDRSTPFAYINYEGDSNGAKTWDFILYNWTN